MSCKTIVLLIVFMIILRTVHTTSGELALLQQWRNTGDDHEIRNNSANFCEFEMVPIGYSGQTSFKGRDQ